MKSKSARLAVLLGVTAGALSPVVFSVACGSGDTGAVQGDSGGTDSTVADSHGDTSPAVDGHLANDGSDAGTAGDTGPVSDSSDFTDIGDVQINVPPLAQYPAAVVDAFCTHMQQCCIQSTDTPSPAQWNQNGDGGCAPFLTLHSGAFGITDHATAVNSGFVAYDAAAAYTCLHEFLAFQCGVVSAAGIQKVKGDCYGAMVGTLVAGAGPCTDSLECKAGYCLVVGDASTGTCAALKGPGQPCSDLANSNDCDYLGLGSPPLYCAPGDAGGGTCQPTLPVDAGCTSQAACQSGVCVSPVCVSEQIFTSTPICRVFTIKDAGGGG